MTLLKFLVFLASCLPAADLAGTFRQLQVAKPSETTGLMAVYREQLRELAASTLAAEPDSKRLRTILQQALRDAGVDGGTVGQVQSVDVLRPPEQPTLLAVTFHIRTNDAIESSLTIYRQALQTWQPAFRMDDAGSLAAPQFTSTGPDGRYLLLLSAALAHQVSIQLLRFDGEFRPLFRRDAPAGHHQAELDADGFRLETWEPSHDSSRGCCEAFPYRYSIQGARVLRIQPFGFDPRQFLEAWLRAPWTEASGLTDPANRTKLSSIHSRQQSFGVFGLPARCDGLGKLWQLSFNAAYFLIERTGTWHFRVLDVSSEPSVSCEPGGEYPWRRTMFAAPLEP